MGCLLPCLGKVHDHAEMLACRILRSSVQQEETASLGHLQPDRGIQVRLDGNAAQVCRVSRCRQFVCHELRKGQAGYDVGVVRVYLAREKEVDAGPARGTAEGY